MNNVLNKMLLADMINKEENVMALINCPECGRENVSDNAEMCPSCGYGIKAHYARLKGEEERIIELKRQEEEYIKSIPKPQKPS